MSVIHVYRCSRCTLDVKKWWLERTRPCPVEGCPGVMRRVNLLQERRATKAKRELAVQEPVAQEVWE